MDRAAHGDGRSGAAVLPDTCGTSDTSPYASHSEITLTVTISGSELVATRKEKGGISRPRSNYTCNYRDGSTITERLTLVVPATPSPSPTPQAVATASTSDPPARTEPTTDGVAASADGPGGLTVSRLGSGAADAPSVLSGLRSPGEVDVRNVIVAAVVTVVLVLLVAFPTSLLNSAVETGSDRLSAWWRRRRGVVDDPEDPDGSGVPWWWAAGGVLVAGVVSSFVDPQFGLNAGSARTLVSVVVGVAVEVVVGWVVVSAVVRRTVPGARRPSPSRRPRCCSSSGPSSSPG